ncbi:9881_t:CDS:1, partial [Dentiscutata heterogama]
TFHKKLCNSTSSEASANSDSREVPPEKKIYSKQDSKYKKEKSVNKLKQKLFAPELSTQDLSIEQNQLKGTVHITEISKILYSKKLTSNNKSSIYEAL